jgi:hypothetical protein
MGIGQWALGICPPYSPAPSSNPILKIYLHFLGFYSSIINCGIWRDGRVVEGAALEMLFRAT